MDNRSLTEAGKEARNGWRVDERGSCGYLWVRAIKTESNEGGDRR